MTISRRAVITGISAAALAPALPSIAPTRALGDLTAGPIMAAFDGALYGTGPMMTAAHVIERMNSIRFPDYLKATDFDGILQLISAEQADDERSEVAFG